MIPRRDSVLRAPGTVVQPLAPPGATVALSVAHHRHRQKPAVRTFVDWLLQHTEDDA